MAGTPPTYQSGFDANTLSCLESQSEISPLKTQQVIITKTAKFTIQKHCLKGWPIKYVASFKNTLFNTLPISTHPEFQKDSCLYVCYNKTQRIIWRLKDYEPQTLLWTEDVCVTKLPLMLSHTVYIVINVHLHIMPSHILVRLTYNPFIRCKECFFFFLV